METPDHGQVIRQQLPKTGQRASYVANDDGEYEAGWWRGKMNANNRDRWKTKTIAGDDIVSDRATGLVWAADGNAAGCNNGAGISFNAAIIYATGLTFAGGNDWRIPNIKELHSLLEADAALYGGALIQEPPFSNTAAVEYWSSTTWPGLVLRGYHLAFNVGTIMYSPKASSYRLRCVHNGI